MNNEIILYKSTDGKLSFDVKIDQDTVWLTQLQMVELFQRDQSVISRHINNVFKEKELDKNSVYANFAYTASDGKSYEVAHYNLDVIVSVGYRVKSQRGTQFRIWATKVLKEHLLNGYSVNTNKLKKIENQIEQILKNEVLLSSQVRQLQEDQKFIKKMQQPKAIVNKIYIDTTPLIESQKHFQKKIEDLNQVLKQIEQKLPTTSDLKKLILDIQETIRQAQTNPKAKQKLLKTLTALGDQNSTITKLLKSAGVTKTLIKKAYDIGLFIIKNLPK